MKRWQNMEDDERLVVVMDRACWDDTVRKAMKIKVLAEEICRIVHGPVAVLSLNWNDKF